MLNFKRGADKTAKARKAKGTGTKKKPKGLEVKFNRATIRCYVILDEVSYPIINTIFLKGNEIYMTLFSIPIANDSVEEWTMTRNIEHSVVSQRLVDLKPIWSSVREGSRVEGKRLGKEFEITSMIKA